MERMERSTSKTGLLCSKRHTDESLKKVKVVKMVLFTSYLYCVELFTLRVCEGSHVKEESPGIFFVNWPLMMYAD